MIAERNFKHSRIVFMLRKFDDRSRGPSTPLLDLHTDCIARRCSRIQAVISSSTVISFPRRVIDRD